MRQKCAPPTRPMAVLSLCFCQGTAPKIFAGKAGKNFRALDNDDKSKSKHARSGLPLRALVAQPSAEHCSADCFPRRGLGGTPNNSRSEFSSFSNTPVQTQIRLRLCFSVMYTLFFCVTEGNIRMKNKEKAPFSRGAYLSYVTRRKWCL